MEEKAASDSLFGTFIPTLRHNMVSTIHTHTHTYIYIYIYSFSVGGDWRYLVTRTISLHNHSQPQV